MIIPDLYKVEINDNLKKNISQFMSNKEMDSCIEGNKLLFKKTIVIIYEKCLECILLIKRNIKNRVKKIKNITLSEQLKSMIIIHNELLSLFLFSQNKNYDEIDKNKTFITYAQAYLESNGGKTFKCEFCEKVFVNYQTLGGHMSKVHPNCSQKYKKQNDIRKQREGKRKLLDLVKEKLFEKYNLDYRALKNSEEKQKIKTFIRAHQKEYEILRRRIYREKALNDCE